MTPTDPIATARKILKEQVGLTIIDETMTINMTPDSFYRCIEAALRSDLEGLLAKLPDGVSWIKFQRNKSGWMCELSGDYDVGTGPTPTAAIEAAMKGEG